MKRKLALVLSLGIIATVITLTGSSLHHFWDWPSVLIVLGITGCLLIAKYNFNEISTHSDDVAKSAINFSLLSGGIGYIIGLIQILQKMSDPTQVGAPLAVCLLSVLYSIILAALIYAMKSNFTISSRLGKTGLCLALATTIPYSLILISLKMNG